VIPPAGSDRSSSCRLAAPATHMGEEPVHARPLGHQPRHVFGTPSQEPDPAPSGHDNHAKEVVVKEHRGNLRPLAHILIALVTALATVVLLAAVLLVLPT
jgi:hypothetical protein